MPKRKWLDKPRWPVRLNFGHPLAQGLSFLLPFIEGGGINGTAGSHELFDAVGGGPVEPTYNTPSGASWVQGEEGSGVLLNNVNTNIQLTGLTLDNALLPTDRVTILAIRRKTDTTSRASSLFGIVSATLNVRCGAHVPFSDGVVYWDFGGAVAPNRVSVSGLTFTTRPERWAFTAGGAGSSIWRDGIKVASQSTAITRTATASVFDINRGNGSGVLGDLQEIYFFAVYREEWDAGLISWWMAEPYAMFMPQQPRVSYFVPTDASLHRPRVFVAG